MTKGRNKLIGWVLWHINHCSLSNVKSSLYLFITYKRFVIVGFYSISTINHYRLFNAKLSLYIHIRYKIFGLVWFYGISTIVGYLMANPLYAYILNI